MQQNQAFACLSIVPIFNTLSAEERMEVSRIAQAKSFMKGDYIYQAGEVDGTLFVLYTGRVKRFRLNVNGKEQVLRSVGPGEFLGELSLFSSLPFTDYAQVTEPCTMCVLEGRRLKELMTKYPAIAFKILDEMSKRLERAENRIETNSLSSVGQRLAMTILELAEQKTRFQLPMSKGDLASQLGMTQETLSRKLAAFQEEGVIEQFGHRGIRILDKEKLEEYTVNEN